MVLAIVVSLLVGAIATSTAEYLKNYNLVDLVVKKVKALLGKGKAAVEAEVKKV